MIALYKYPEQGVQKVSTGNKEPFHGKLLLPNWKLPRPCSEGIQAGMERGDLGHHSCEGLKRSWKGKKKKRRKLGGAYSSAWPRYTRERGFITKCLWGPRRSLQSSTPASVMKIIALHALQGDERLSMLQREEHWGATVIGALYIPETVASSCNLQY